MVTNIWLYNLTLPGQNYLFQLAHLIIIHLDTALKPSAKGTESSSGMHAASICLCHEGKKWTIKIFIFFYYLSSVYPSFDMSDDEEDAMFKSKKKTDKDDNYNPRCKFCIHAIIMQFLLYLYILHLICEFF